MAPPMNTPRSEVLFGVVVGEAVEDAAFGVGSVDMGLSLMG